MFYVIIWALLYTGAFVCAQSFIWDPNVQSQQQKICHGSKNSTLCPIQSLFIGGKFWLVKFLIICWQTFSLIVAYSIFQEFF